MQPYADMLAGPTMLTVLPTYRCTAACTECCFESSQHVKGRMTLEQITLRITKAHKAFPTLRMVCFSGGECFLIGKDLDLAIAHAHSLGLLTRCVSNGYWAMDADRANRRIGQLVEAGLNELNISTGDEHQQWVPFDRAAAAVMAGANHDITSILVIEGSTESVFKMADVYAHEELNTFLLSSPHASKLRIIQNVWMSFHKDRSYTHPERVRDISRVGCDNILNNIVATPSGQMASCCGLTMEHIPELKIGDGDTDDFAAMYEAQLNDFLKVWIAVDGPTKIIEFAKSRNALLNIESAPHICETCVRLYHDKAVQKTLLANYHEVVTDVFTRFYLKRSISRLTSVGSPLAEPFTPEMLGA